MADMKQIFTYPSNSGTDWIDPNYIGDANSGLTRRVDELLAGAYKSWTNLDPVSDLGTTNTELMQNLSKFITYFDEVKLIENLTFYDFWENPMVIVNKTPVAPDATIQLGDTNNPGTITTTADNEFVDGMKIRLSGLNGTWQFLTSPNTDYFAKIIATDQLQVATDSGLTNLIGYVSSFTDDLSTTLTENNSVIKITFNSSYDFPDATAININSVQYNGQAMVGNTYYIKEDAAPVYELYQDSALTTPLTPADIRPFTNTVHSGTITQQSNPGEITFSSALTSDELVAYPESNTGFYGDGTLFNTNLTETIYLKTTSDPLKYEMYRDSALTNPFNTGENKTILMTDVGTVNVAFPTITEPLDDEALIVGNDKDFLPYFDGRATPLDECLGNLDQLDGTTVYPKDISTQVGLYDFVELYYDAAYTSPVSRDSLNPSLFTDQANFTLDPAELNLTYLSKSGLGNNASYMYAGTSIPDFIGANDKLYINSNNQILKKDGSTYVVAESQTFFGLNGVDFIPNGSINDTATIDLSHRTDVTINKIKYVGPDVDNNPLLYGNKNAASNLVTYNGGDYYVDDIGGGINEMYLDAGLTQPLTLANYIASEGMPGGNLTANTFECTFERPPYTTTHNIIDSRDLLTDEQRIIYFNNDVESAIEDSKINFFDANTWYYLEYITGTSNPYKYKVWEDAAYTQKQTIDWQNYLTTTDILNNPAIYPDSGRTVSYYNPQGIILDWNTNNLALQLMLQSAEPDLNITSITGNGQNLANTQYYYTKGTENQNVTIYTDSAKTIPLAASSISNNSAGYTGQYKFIANKNYDGTTNGFITDTTAQPYNRLAELNGIVLNKIGQGEGAKNLEHRKLIFNDTDAVNTDNKLLAQAGLLTNGATYYTDYVTSTNNNNSTGLSSADGIGLFTTFNNSEALPYEPSVSTTPIASAGSGPFTQVPEFPETLITGDKGLDLVKYAEYPYNANGDTIASTTGVLMDDGNSVVLNDPVNHASSFGWFTITTHNNFANAVAVNDWIRLSPTEKCRYTGFTLNSERLFELVDNSDVKIPVTIPTTADYDFTDSMYFPCNGDGYFGSPYDYDNTQWQEFTTTPTSDGIIASAGSQVPTAYLDSATGDWYVGIDTGNTYESVQQAPGSEQPIYLFWSKADWDNGGRHLTSVPSTLKSQFRPYTSTTLRSTSATFNYEDAFAFNNIIGLDTVISEGVRLGTTIYPTNENTRWFAANDYSIDLTEPSTEAGRPQSGTKNDPVSYMFAARNTGYDQYRLTQDIVIPALARHTLSSATNMLYVEEITWSSPTDHTVDREHVVTYNPTYNNTDTTANPYYGYFNHGDIIDLPGVDGTATASYVLLKRGSNTKLKFRYTTSATPDPTTDITTEDMTGEVWSVLPLFTWQASPGGTNTSQGRTSGGSWNNNEMWLSQFPQPQLVAQGSGYDANIILNGPIQSLPMFTKLQTSPTYPNTYTQSTGSKYTGNVTVRAGNIANGTAPTSAEFGYVSNKAPALNHTNAFTFNAEQPWNLGEVGISSYPISENAIAGQSYNSYGMDFETLNPVVERSEIKRYLNSGDTANFYPYYGNPKGVMPVDMITPTINITPAYQGDVNMTLVSPPAVNTTQGTISISPNETQPYKAGSVDIVMPGNETYSYQDTNNTTVYQAQIHENQWYEPGGSYVDKASAETDATFDVTVNGSGKLQSVSLNTTGRFDNAEPQLRYVESPPNQYVPPTPTPAELEDVWDTDDEWASDGSSQLKVWPDHVTPMSAVINYNSPTLVNNSQSGIKYTRSVGHTKWRLEVEYPPMSAEDFQKFHAIAQAAHGQSTPFYFRLRNKDNVNILWADFNEYVNTTTTPLIKDDITAGDTTMLVEGFSSNEADAFIRGEVFIDGNNANGYLHTSLSGTSSNIFGEAKIRTPWPFRSDQLAGSKIYKDPYHAVVTLASDNFEYQVDVNNYYYVSVAFDLDNWK